MERRALILTAILVASCGGGGDAPTPPATVAPTCAEGLVAQGAICVPRFDDCGDVATPILGGGCRAVGVPKDGCAKGFEHDGNGCKPILPATKCEPGMMAIPGETKCREISPCGTGTWGAIPVDATTIYVDQAAAIGGDGTKERPFQTISEAAAITIPANDSIIAIAAGTYVENVLISRRARLWGRCPSMVEIKGPDAKTEAAPIELRSDGAVRGLTVSGPWYGIVAVDGNAVTIDSVRVHATGRSGIGLFSSGKPLLGTIKNTLVESAAEGGIYVEGASADIDGVVVRDITPAADKKYGNGIRVQLAVTGTKAASAKIKNTVVDRTTELGIAILGSTATIDATVVRETAARATDKKAGVGIYGFEHAPSKTLSDITVTSSYVSGNRRSGITMYGGRLTIERTVVRDGQPRLSDMLYGTGIEVGPRSELVLTDSVISDNRYVGVMIAGGKGSILRTLVRNTIGDAASGDAGVGIAAFADANELLAAEVEIVDSLVLGNQSAGVQINGAKATITGSAIRDTKVRTSTGTFGDGISIEAVANKFKLYPAELTLEASLITGNARAGVVLRGGNLAIRRATVRCNAFDLEVSRHFAYDEMGNKVENDFLLDDGGDVVCGCAVTATCKAQTSGLEPIGSPKSER